MKTIERIVSAVSKVASWIGIATTVVMMCAVFLDVIMRTFFTRSIPGVTELAQGCWVLMALSFGVVALENANTMVDIFVLKMPPQVRRIVILAVDILAIVFCVLVGWKTIDKGLSSMDSNIMLVSLGVKEWPFIILFAISFFVCAVATVLVLIREFKENTEACRETKSGKTEKEEV